LKKPSKSRCVIRLSIYRRSDLKSSNTSREYIVAKRVEELLEEAGGCKCALSGKCRRIIKHREHLWTFVQDQSVDPTNNLAERIVRQGVLWRKSSFGTQSERGALYVKRILTVGATCRLQGGKGRLQGRSIIEYLREACRCHLDGIAVPSLIKSAGNLAKSA